MYTNLTDEEVADLFAREANTALAWEILDRFRLAIDVIEHLTTPEDDPGLPIFLRRQAD